MPTTYPSAWLLLAVPFLSSLVVRHSPPLLRLATRMNRFTRPVGAIGLLLLCAGLVGLLPLPLALLGGAVSGYTVFSAPGDSDGGDDWRRPGPPPEEPPPPSGTDGPIDWQGFDRLREEWERPSVSSGR